MATTKKPVVMRAYRLHVDVDRRLREIAEQTRRSKTGALEAAVDEMWERVFGRRDGEEAAGRVARR